MNSRSLLRLKNLQQSDCIIPDVDPATLFDLKYLLLLVQMKVIVNVLGSRVHLHLIANPMQRAP